MSKKGEKVRDAVVCPQRRLTFVFTHPTLGDSLAGSVFADAFAEYNEALRADDAMRIDWQNYTAANGVHIQASAAEVVLPEEWCDTMERPKAQCGCPDCGSSLIDLGPGLRNTPPAPAVDTITPEGVKQAQADIVRIRAAAHEATEKTGEMKAILTRWDMVFAEALLRGACDHQWGAFPLKGGAEAYVAKCVKCDAEPSNTVPAVDASQVEITHPVATQDNAATIMYGLLHSFVELAGAFPSVKIDDELAAQTRCYMPPPLLVCSERIRAAILTGDKWATGLAMGLGSLAREYTKAMTTPNAEPIVRFCPECGSVGEVPEGARDCCPDGSAARYVPQKFAEQCRATFELAIAPTGNPPNAGHVMRRIRRCENETAAQVVLEHFARTVRDTALEEAAQHAEQWGDARQPEYGGHALRNCAASIRAKKGGDKA